MHEAEGGSTLNSRVCVFPTSFFTLTFTSIMLGLAMSPSLAFLLAIVVFNFK